MTGELRLRQPRADDEKSLRHIHEQMRPEGFAFLLAEGPWDEVLATIDNEARGVDLAPGRVRSEFLVAEVAGELVGRVSIRFALNDFLRREGGHIGYGVAPEHRGRSYAKAILRHAVARLVEDGTTEVLVTCDDSNRASAAVIEACGGVLEDITEIAGGTLKRRYWIDAGRVAPG